MNTNLPAISTPGRRDVTKQESHGDDGSRFRVTFSPPIRVVSESPGERRKTDERRVSLVSEHMDVDLNASAPNVLGKGPGRLFPELPRSDSLSLREKALRNSAEQLRASADHSSDAMLLDSFDAEQPPAGLQELFVPPLISQLRRLSSGSHKLLPLPRVASVEFCQSTVGASLTVDNGQLAELAVNLRSNGGEKLRTTGSVSDEHQQHPPSQPPALNEEAEEPPRAMQRSMSSLLRRASAPAVLSLDTPDDDSPMINLRASHAAGTVSIVDDYPPRLAPASSSASAALATAPAAAAAPRSPPPPALLFAVDLPAASAAGRRPVPLASARSASSADTYTAATATRDPAGSSSVAGSGIIASALPTPPPPSRGKDEPPLFAAASPPRGSALPRSRSLLLPTLPQKPSTPQPRSKFVTDKKNIEMVLWLRDFYQAIEEQSTRSSCIEEAFEKAAIQFKMSPSVTGSFRAVFFGAETMPPFRHLLLRMFPDAKRGDQKELCDLAFPQQSVVRTGLTDEDKLTLTELFQAMASEEGCVNITKLPVLLAKFRDFSTIELLEITKYAAQGCPFSGEVTLAWFLESMEQWSASSKDSRQAKRMKSVERLLVRTRQIDVC